MAAKSQPHYHPGDKIGNRYQVHQALMGGMGEVYLCLDLEIIQPFALKTFQQRYQSAALRKAFEQEVATWVALEKHPNIVRCFMMEILDNRPFMVLEWIAGEEGKGADLRGWLRHGPLDLQMALKITIDIVRGLIHARQKQPGLVHRDLKPENILVAQGPLAKITDFGLAQVVERAGLELNEAEAKAEERQSLVQQGGVVGTPAYMAPEQWRGESLDERSDIYALGCILYELLVGHGPVQVGFTPTNQQQYQQWLRQMQASHERSVPADLPAGLPVGLRQVLDRCLAKARVDRLGSLDGLLAELSQLYEQNFGTSPPARAAPEEFTAGDYNNRALTYANLKQYEMALADYNRTIQLEPNDVVAYNNRGLTYADLQRYEVALVDYNRAIQLDPNYALAYTNRGLTYVALRQYETALADYNRAIQLDPNLALAYISRGLIHHHLRQYEAALADYNRAIQVDPTNAAAYTNRGNTYASLQRYEAALTDYTQAIQLNPNYALAYSNRGNTYADLRQYEAALADFTQAIQLDPNEAEAYYNRGLTYADLQQYGAALADFTQAIQLDPNEADTYINRGSTYAALRRYEAALADFTRVIQLDPNYAQAYYNRGLTYAKLRQYEAALADYGRAIQLDPNFAPAHLNIGALLGNWGRLQEALPYFEKAAQLGDPAGMQYVMEIRKMLNG